MHSFAVRAHGGAALELAVVLPVLVILAIGVADYGRVLYTGIAIGNAARAGAAYGSQSSAKSSDVTGITAATRDDAGDNTITVATNTVCRCPGIAGTPSCSTSCPAYADGVAQLYLTVRATKQVTFLLRYPTLPASITVSDSATFRVQ
jgi:Flp pilus assembly protein TadG